MATVYGIEPPDGHGIQRAEAEAEADVESLHQELRAFEVWRQRARRSRRGGVGCSESGWHGGEAPSFLSPDSMVDHFRVARLVGRGGMGEVYLARDTLLNRRVALKVIHPRYLDSEAAVARFMREAQLTAGFSHPHIVTVYAVGKHEGRLYLALEYLEGQNLRQRMDEERPGVRESLRIVLAIARALAEAHRHHVLHRDLKPDNVVLAKDGRLRLVDLGLAKVRSPGNRRAGAGPLPDCPLIEHEHEHEHEHEREREREDRRDDGCVSSVWHPDPAGAAALAARPGASRPDGEVRPDGEPRRDCESLAGGAAGGSVLHNAAAVGTEAVGTGKRPSGCAGHSSSASDYATVAGTIQGTPAYMAPEQWRGEEGSEATDIWALGVIFFELLAGRRPYRESTSASLGSAVTGPDPAPALALTQDVSGDLIKLAAGCLAKDAARRSSAAQVVDALEQVLAGDRRQVAVDLSPFRGLFPFGERHADLFFGRDSELALFLESLREQAVLPVVGPSGAGKSSFVQAGVIPRLREQGAWIVLAMRPGADPFCALAARLAAGESSLAPNESMGSIHTSDFRLPARLLGLVGVEDES
ncbi:MAG: serine/threonine-protein kinase, partial [Pseudomonadota bacterium]